MKVQTPIQPGIRILNHNQVVVQPVPLRVANHNQSVVRRQTVVAAPIRIANHNQTLVRASR